MKYCFYFFITIIFYSCNGQHTYNVLTNVNDTLKEQKNNTSSLINIKPDTSKDLDDDSDISIVPFNIDYDIFKQPILLLDDPFNLDSALKGLFPGHYYKFPLPVDKTDTITLEAWSCAASHPEQFNGWDSGDIQMFPLKDSNETRFVDTLQYIDDDGEKNIFISFSTTAFTTDFIGVGRFTGAILGLAQFTYENNKWCLKTFSPAIGYYGAFQTIPKIHLLKLGKNNYGCYIENSNGPAGGPFYSDDYVFGIVNNKIKVLLTILGAAKSQGDSFTEWDSRFLHKKNDSLNIFPELQVEIKGTDTQRKKIDDYDDITTDLPSTVKQIVNPKSNFSFTILTSYKYIDGAYKFENQEIKTKNIK
jgi:hypothetical protein